MRKVIIAASVAALALTVTAAPAAARVDKTAPISRRRT